jgi:HTH-type transcriptional regulator / antitoxin HigA
MDIRPIRTEADNQAALAEISALMATDPELGTPDGDRLDVLVTLVQAFEAGHYPVDPPDAVEAIKFRMEQQGLTARDLEPMIGSQSRVSEVLNRKRPLSMAMVWRLHQGLGIPAESLIRPPQGDAVQRS